MFKKRRLKEWIRTDLSPDHQPWNDNNSRRNNLDFMRFLFAVLVIFSHSYILILGNNSLEPVWKITQGQTTGGFLAVAFFFIVSGFLITQSWMNAPQIVSFFRKRILRIYPAFIVMALICVLLIAPLGSSDPRKLMTAFSPVRFGINTFFLYMPAMEGVFAHNPVQYAVNGSAWTIKYEFWCYILTALLGVIGLFHRRRLVLILFGLILFIYGLQLFGIIDLSVLPNQGKIGLIFGSWTYYPEFLSLFFGGAVFYLFRDQIPFSKIVFVFSILLLMVLSQIANWLIIAIPMLGTYIILYLGFHPFIRMQTFTHHGDFSYGIYLFAYPVQQLLVYYEGLRLTPFILFSLSFGLTFILAFLSWHLIEKPALMLKRRDSKYQSTMPSNSSQSLTSGANYSPSSLRRLIVWAISALSR